MIRLADLPPELRRKLAVEYGIKESKSNASRVVTWKSLPKGGKRCELHGWWGDGPEAACVYCEET